MKPNLTLLTALLLAPLASLHAAVIATSGGKKTSGHSPKV
jgi:hypothetical protein